MDDMTTKNDFNDPEAGIIKKLKMFDLVELALNRTKQMLLQPISLKKWAKLLFIAWLAGALGGGFSFNYNNNINNIPKQPDVSELQSSGQYPEYSGDGNIDIEIELEENIPEENIVFRYISEKDFTTKEFISRSKELLFSEKIKPVFYAVIAVLILICLVTLLFIWLYSRFLFIWYESVAHDKAAIVEPFKRFKFQGESIFMINVLTALTAYAVMAALFLWAVKIIKTGLFIQGPDDIMILEMFKALGPVITTAVIIVTLFGLWNMFLTKFIVAFMAEKNISFFPAVKEFMRVFSVNKKNLLYFILTSLVLGMAIGVLYIFIAILLILSILLLALLLIGTFYFIFAFWLKLMMVFKVLLIISIIFIMIGTMILFPAVLLPVAVFYQNFVLYYITNLNCGYSPVVIRKQASASR